MSVRRNLLLALTVAALGLGALASPATASTRGSAPTAHRDHRPLAVVSLGDSYISGEAGRWLGNSAAVTPGRLGTDRAWRPSATAPAGTIDPARVYGASAANGCHRSDTAPIRSAGLPFVRAINLACSGARTYHVLRASAGGMSFKGEAPQDDQLAQVAQQNRVKLIDLSIGGNDLGFSDVVTSCVLAYVFASTPCSVTQQAGVQQRLPLVATKVAAVVDDIRATMRGAGYRDGDYRLIVQSYPQVSPAPGLARYSGTAPDQRSSVGGCPFLDVDSQWSRAVLVPGLTATLAGVARAKGVQFLDLADAFRGHELCASTDRQSTGTPRGSSSEWVRFIDLTGQGDVSESLHPNAYGQQAMGRCLALAALVRRDAACHAVTYWSPRAIYLTMI